MKKKFSIWLNIVTICLCIAAIAIGVYAATSATLQVQGQIGFTAHNCDVDISGYIYGHAEGDSESGAPVDAPTGENDKVKLQAGTSGDTNTSTPYIAEIRGSAGSLKIGNRYFSDAESTDGKPSDIVIVITAKNVSEFDIEAEVGTITTPSTAVKATVVASINDSISKNGEITFTITLSMQKTGDIYEEIDMPKEGDDDNLSIPITFKKSVSYTVTVNYANDLFSSKVSGDNICVDGNIYNGFVSLTPGQHVIKVKESIVIEISGWSTTGFYLYVSTTTNICTVSGDQLGISGWLSSVLNITSNVTFNIEITSTPKS